MSTIFFSFCKFSLMLSNSLLKIPFMCESLGFMLTHDVFSFVLALISTKIFKMQLVFWFRVFVSNYILIFGKIVSLHLMELFIFAVKFKSRIQIGYLPQKSAAYTQLLSVGGSERYPRGLTYIWKVSSAQVEIALIVPLSISNFGEYWLWRFAYEIIYINS